MDTKEKPVEEAPSFSEQTRTSQNNIIKNLIVISLAFTLLFTAYQSMQNLQSSLNSEEGLGSLSLFCLYGAFLFSSVFLPTVVIEKLGAKRTLVVCMLCYSAYMAAQFYPKFYTLCPTAVILGLAAAPLWSSKCTYLSVTGRQFALIKRADAEHMVVRFFGVFFLAFQTSQIWGNLIASEVLSSDSNNNQSMKTANYSRCGPNFCPQEVEEAITAQKPSLVKIYTLATVYLVCAVASAGVIALFLDPIDKIDDEYKKRISSGGSNWKKPLLATLTQLKDPRQTLLVPITFYTGVAQGFIATDFTQGFVTCGWGVGNVGYVMIAYGVCDALCSLGFGVIVKLIGRIPVFIIGGTLNLIVIIVMFVWMPTPDESVVFFVLAALWGIADAVWQTQVNAIHGVLFPDKEASAFSNYKLWESVGFLVVFLCSSLLCMYVKLWSLLVFLGVGMIAYAFLEILLYKKY